MKMFNNMNLKTKLLTLFTIVTILIAGGLIFGVSTMRSNHTSYVYLLEHPVQRMEHYGEAKYSVMGMRRAYLLYCAYSENKELLTQSYNEALEFADAATEHLNICYDNIQSDAKLSQETKDAYSKDIQNIILGIEDYINRYVIPGYNTVIQSGDIQEFVNAHADEGILHASSIINNLDKMSLRAKSLLNISTETAFNTANYLIIQMIVVFAVILIVMILLFFIIAHEISTPIKQFIEKLIKVDYVNLDTQGKKEVNDLIKNILG